MTELPAIPVDGDRLIDQNVCSAPQGSEFVVTGRGGLPASPNEPLSSEVLWEDLRLTSVEESPSASVQSEGSTPTLSTLAASTTLVEAQGWVVDAQGKVVLVAESQNAGLRTNELPDCGARQASLQ